MFTVLATYEPATEPLEPPPKAFNVALGAYRLARSSSLPLITQSANVWGKDLQRVGPIAIIERVLGRSIDRPVDDDDDHGAGAINGEAHPQAGRGADTGDNLPGGERRDANRRPADEI